MGRDILDAVKRGRSSPRTPPPKVPSNGRKRIDRKTERLVNRLKRWRAARAQELELDPGVLCPNSSLEAIAWKNPEKPGDLKEVQELKGWFVKEFGEEVVTIVGRDDHPEETSPTGPAEKAPTPKSAAASSAPPKKKRRRRKKKKGTRESSRAPLA